VKRRIVFGLTAFFAAVLASAQGPGDTQPTVIMAPVGNVQLRAGSSTDLALDFRIGTDFHINSNKPRADYLIPTVLKLNPSEPVAVADVQYPPGEDMSFAFSPNEKLSVYSGDFSINSVLRAPANAAAGTYPVKGELRFQACDRSACYPPRSIPVQFQVTVVKK
jgi:Thiol:disulfide interchange protein DsbD, N-terminal